MNAATPGGAREIPVSAGQPGVIDSVVLLSPFPWNGVWQTTHYVARELARRVRVLYVEPRVGWHPGEAGFSAARLHRLGASWLRQESPSLHIFTPPSAPFGRWPKVRALNERAFVRGVEGARRSLGLARPLVWVSYYLGCLQHVQRLGLRPYVYHCLDHFEHGDPAEEAELSRSANLVFAVSGSLLDRHRQHNPKAELLPNGVAVDWFDKATGPPGDLADLADSKRVVGFVGQLSRHVDLTLLEKVARDLPDTVVLLVGPVVGGSLAPRGAHAQALRALRSLANVRLLGFRPPQELPGYLQRMDVCLMPFRRDAFVAHADPIKFYQYLAAGKAIVTTPIPLAQRYPTLCRVAGSPSEFVEGVRQALAEPPGRFRRERLDVARAHGWRQIVERAFESVLGSIGSAT